VSGNRRSFLGNDSVNTFPRQRIIKQQSRQFLNSDGNGVFCSSAPRLYNQDNTIQARVEAGTNTSTVALRVEEGDEKGTQCLGL
jgi:hypothetical protein